MLIIHMEKRTNKRLNILTNILALGIVIIMLGACEDPALTALNGVWEVTSITTDGTQIDFPVSYADAGGGLLSLFADIDADGENEDIIEHLYYRFSDGVLRAFHRIEHLDPGEPADEDLWDLPEIIAFDSAADVEYSQIGYTLTLEGMAEDGSDAFCTFSVSGGVLTCKSDDGSYAMSATEQNASVLKGAVEISEDDEEL